MQNTDMQTLLQQNGIRDVDLTRSPEGVIEKLSVCFGPHYFMQLQNIGGTVEFTLGVTHHGMTFDASEVGGELEQAMNAMSRAGRAENLP
ncbi:hypothetical protein [Deinococcus navajonensis]|uniref:Uncharacterized protein n=1 Tax=Deinococcus navajonensis TaxID=309884 RepID=A0ABV8XQK1_9DEIO